MWRKRRKRKAKLSRQLALGRLEDALGRVDEQRRRPGTSSQPQVPAERPEGPGKRLSA
jgi:hypothetical protein